MTDTHDTQALAEGGRLIDQMFTRLLRGDSLQDFGDWFASAAAAPGGPVDDPRAARAMARALWGALPLPSNHWRARVACGSSEGMGSDMGGLLAMREGMPPEAFRAVLDIAQRTLAPRDHARLVRDLGPGVAPVAAAA